MTETDAQPAPGDRTPAIAAPAPRPAWAWSSTLARVAPDPPAPAEPAPHASSKPEALAEPERAAAAEPEPHAPAQPEPRTPAQPEPLASAEPDPHASHEPDPHAPREPDPHASHEPDPHAPREPDPHAPGEPDPHASHEPDPHASHEPDPHASAEPDPLAHAAAATPPAPALPWASHHQSPSRPIPSVPTVSRAPGTRYRGGYRGPAPSSPVPSSYAWSTGIVPVLACEVCGSLPAAQVTLRQHIGLVLFWRRRKWVGRYCRTCGLAAFREKQNRTLLTQWWGPGSLLIFSWLTPLQNLTARGRLTALSPPCPNPYGPSRAPDHPGRPVWLRLGFLLSAPIVVALVVVAGIFYSRAPQPIDVYNTGDLPGRCVVFNEDPSLPTATVTGTVDCSQQHAGRVVSVGVPGAGCPGSLTEFGVIGDSRSNTICIDLSDVRR